MSRKWLVFPFIVVAAGLMAFGSTATAEPGDGGTTTNSSAPVAASLPRISGEARQRTPLSASDGSWGNSPDSYTYQWRRCGSAGGNCSNISGATSNAYVPRSADVSHTIRIVVTASNSYGSSSATSARTAVVLSETAPPANNWDWVGLGCHSYNTPDIANTVCNYNYLSPFVVKGSTNGPGTLQYQIQCQKWGKVNPKVLFKRSFKLKKGKFKVRGVKAIIKPAERCPEAYKVGPALTASLILGESASSGKIDITIDGNLPWGKK